MKKIVATNKIEHLHLFRAFAIIGVVACHTLSEQVWLAGSPTTSDSTNLLNAFTETFFHNSTLLFAVISGLLFSLILQKKGWNHFFINKVKNVLAPYLFLSGVFTLLVWQPESIMPDINGLVVDEFLSEWGRNVLFGTSMFQFWYIPVLLILYGLTPLILMVYQHKYGKYIFAILLMLPLLLSRTWPAMSFHTIAYFLGAYVLGCWIGYYYEEFKQNLARYIPVLWIGFILTTISLFFFYYKQFETDFISIRESFSYLHKICLSGLIIYYLSRQPLKKNVNQRVLTIIADYAFAIYFLHIAVLMSLQNWQLAVFKQPVSLWEMLSFGCLFLMLTIGLSILLAKIIQFLFKQYSKLLVGV